LKVVQERPAVQQGESDGKKKKRLSTGGWKGGERGGGEEIRRTVVGPLLSHIENFELGRKREEGKKGVLW